MTYPVLAITDGTTRVSLLATRSGLHLRDWSPMPPTAKGGGVWQDGQLSDGRRLAVKKWSNIVDTYTLSVTNFSQDQLIRTMQDLRRLLEKAVEYWTTEWQGEPVWIEAQAGCETNLRYALIYDYQASGEGTPYATPFAGRKPAIASLSLALEHGPWLSQVPGVGECVELKSIQEHWMYTVWAINSALPTTDINVMFQTRTGRLLAAQETDGKIWRTDDGGVTAWADSAAHTTIPLVIVQAGNDLYFGGTGGLGAGIYRSTDDGENWVQQNATRVVGEYDMIYRSQDGYLYLIDYATRVLYRSNDLGVTFNAVAGAPTVCAAIIQVSGGDMYIASLSGYLYRSANGTTWAQYSRLPSYVDLSAQYISMWYPGDGYMYLTGLTPVPTWWVLWRSKDGIDWEECKNAGDVTAEIQSIVYTSWGELYMSRDGLVYKSPPGALSFSHVISIAPHYCLIQYTVQEQIFVGAGGNIWASGRHVDAGQEETCYPYVYVANKHNPAQLTHVYVYDDTGAVFTPQFAAAAFPFNLLPAVPAATADCIYMGIDTVIDLDGPFNNVVFNIAAHMYATSYTILWEYCTAHDTWATLTVQDNTVSFSRVGVGSVHWVPPTDWIATEVNGVTAWWVRARVTAIAGSISAPTQATRNLYTANTNGVTVDADDAPGDIPALLETWLTMMSDKDGPAGSAPDAWANRYILGLRSTSRGAFFSPFLNFSDTQPPLGITAAGTAITVAAANPQTATGRQYTHTNAGGSAWTSEFTFTLSPTIAASFYGRFRIFLRARQHDKHIGDVRVRLKAVYGSGGLSVTGDYAAFASLLDWQLLDLGSFVFPPIPVNGTDLGNQMQLVLEIWANDTADVHLYDLALLPTDEWAGDFVDKTLASGSEVGNGYLFDLDSVSYPKEKIRSLVRTVGSDTGLIRSDYQPITAGPAILQANADQNLYVLCARYASGVWYSEPWITHSVKLQAVFRYLLMRGDR